MEPSYAHLGLSFLALVGGLIMLVVGGEVLVSGAGRLALRWGMSTMLVGLTVVAFGTSIPELFVSLKASFNGHIDIMIGNVVGSNIANVGLVLACSAILAPLAVHIKVLKTELYLLLSISLIVAVICWFGTFYRILGIMFIAGLILYTYLAYHDVRNHRVKEEELQGKKFSYWILLCLIVGGLVLLALGADFFIDGAVDMARYFGVSELVIGLTLAAVGTSLPELASCISAARRKESDMIVGNVIGSNLFNLMMVFGTTAAVMPFHLERQLLCRDLPVMIAFSAVLVPCLVLWQGVRRWHGVLLLCCYLGYLYTLL